MASLAGLWMAHASGTAMAAEQGTKSYTIRSPRGEDMPGRCTVRAPHRADHSTWPDPQLPTLAMQLAVWGGCERPARGCHMVGRGKLKQESLK